jgi:hypothetical protein
LSQRRQQDTELPEKLPPKRSKKGTLKGIFPRPPHVNLELLTLLFVYVSRDSGTSSKSGIRMTSRIYEIASFLDNFFELTSQKNNSTSGHGICANARIPWQAHWLQKLRQIACRGICAECAMTGPLATKFTPNGLSRNLRRMREIRDRPIGHKIYATWPVTESAQNARNP